MAVQSDSARDQVVEILGVSLFHAKELRESLHQEREALESQDMDSLLAAAETKGTQVRELQQLDAQRSRICTESGFSAGREQMDAFLDWCDHSGEATHSWEQLLEVAEECSQLNAANGAVIRVRRQQVEDGLAVLRGQPMGVSTYDRDGVSRDGLGHHAIAEA